ncbi:MAG: UDP-N-acetylmuramoyl-tripeptide--D-alanyl-D-alanine ligase [Polyangiaceae bacterium]
MRHRDGRVAVGVATDSRVITPGGAFVALRGPTHDGHAHLDAAVAAGAALVVVERGRSPRDPRVDVVEVDDTLVALGAIAREHLRSWRALRPMARVVAVTGSAGKTTTKELCAALLRTAGSCHFTRGNLNNLVGVPCVILCIEPHHEFAVIEMGMSRPGEIATLCALVEPDVGIVTNVGFAHAEGVGGSLADVAREKGALFESLRSAGIAVANVDDAAVMDQLRRAQRVRAVTFGVAAGADYRVLARSPLGEHGDLATLRRPGREPIDLCLRLSGQAAAVDLAAALAAAEAAIGGPIHDALVHEALSEVGPMEGRLQLVRLAAGICVIDDSYNANPTSVRASLATLAEVATARRVAVLGEMKEIGPAAEQEHDAIGAAAAEAGVGLLVSCGGLADRIAAGAARLGVAVIVAPDADAAARAVLDAVQPLDTVLVKASRSIGAERVVEALVRAHREDAF